MGQRHQIFVVVPNPIKSGDHSFERPFTNCLGDRDFSILPFHNQWLYGRTALQVVDNVLTHSSALEHKVKTDPKAYGGYNSPFTLRCFGMNFRTPEKWIASIEFILNYIPKKTFFNDPGFLGAFYIGEDYDGNECDDFTIGDNNDGITIIDTINNKYCFMNIYDQDEDPSCTSVGHLPHLKPASAHEYVECYYPESVDRMGEYELERAKEENKTPEEWVNEHRVNNDKLVKKLKKYKLLTVDEVCNFFPKLKKEIIAANNIK